MKVRAQFLCLIALLFVHATVAAGQSSGCCGYKKLRCTPARVKSPATKGLPVHLAGEGILPDPEIVRFAVIGDYGQGQYLCERSVARMIAQWNREAPLDFIITLGDNNYQKGAASTLKKNILNYYAEYIKRGVFYPSLGNHDWDTIKKTKPYAFGRPYPYLDLFSYLARFSPVSDPPVAGRYYQVSVKNRVDLFALDSNYQEQDGTCCDSKQAAWLKQSLGSSTSPWKLVYFHHPPYSTAKLDFPGVWMRWPYQQWCATAILTGHEHVYERIDKAGFPYFVNGLGGNAYTYNFKNCPVEQGSAMRFNSAPGAMLVIANSKEIEFGFYSIDDPKHPVDRYRIDSPPPCKQPPGRCTPPPELFNYCKQQPPRKAPVEPDCPAGNFPANPP